MTLHEFLADLGLQDPQVSEFRAHPDYRQIATFFLGWVFFLSIQQLIMSELWKAPLRHLLGLFSRSSASSTDSSSRLSRRPEITITTGLPSSHEKVNTWMIENASTYTRRRVERTNLTFTLTICFALASLAQTISLTTFKANGDAGCAFVVALGGMAAQSARIVGLLKMSFDLAALGVRRWETLAFWGWLVTSLVFMFITNAVSIGTLRPLNDGNLPGVSLCYRKHFLPAALVSSLINIFLEIYCIVRLFFFLSPAFLVFKDRLGSFTDIRILRGSSLLLLDLLTIVPSLAFFSILADYVPFSFGAVIALAAFNFNPCVSTLAAETMTVPTLSRNSVATADLGSLVLPPPNPVAPRPPRRSAAPAPEIFIPSRSRVPHPFTSVALEDNAIETDYPAPVSPEAALSPDLDSPVESLGVINIGPSPNSRERQSFLASDSATTRSTESSDNGPRRTPSSKPPRIPSSIIQFVSRSSSAKSSASRSTPRTPHQSLPSISVHDVPLPPMPAPMPPHDWRKRDNGARRSTSTATTTNHSSNADSTPSSPTRATSRRQSATSSRYPPADDDLSVVYEASFEAVNELDQAQGPRPTTFGSGEFLGVATSIRRTPSPRPSNRSVDTYGPVSRERTPSPYRGAEAV